MHKGLKACSGQPQYQMANSKMMATERERGNITVKGRITIMSILIAHQFFDKERE